MQPSLWTSIYVSLSPEEALRRLSELGWRCFELSCEHLRVLAECPRRAARARRFRQLCRKSEVAVPQCHLPLKTNFAQRNNRKRRKELRQSLDWIELAADLGIKVGVLHPGGGDGIFGRPDWDRVRQRNLDAYAELAAKAEEVGLRIAVENMMDSAKLGRRRFGAMIWELRDLIGAVGSPALGICLDTSHAHVQALDIPEAIRECGDLLIATHVSDNDGSGDQHRLPGQGNIAWPQVMAAVHESGYRGPWNLEIPGERGGPEVWVAERMKYALAVATEMLKPEFAAAGS